MPDLAERLDSHMGLADMAEVLADCRAAAARITALEKENAELRAGLDLVVGAEPVGYIGKASLQLLQIGEMSGCALTADPPKVAHVALYDRPAKLDSVLDKLRKLTFAVQHNPNCPSPWLVRLPGKGPIDMLPYGDPLRLVKHQTGDVLGFGKTLEEAGCAALSARPALRDGGGK